MFTSRSNIWVIRSLGTGAGLVEMHQTADVTKSNIRRHNIFECFGQCSFDCSDHCESGEKDYLNISTFFEISKGWASIHRGMGIFVKHFLDIQLSTKCPPSFRQLSTISNCYGCLSGGHLADIWRTSALKPYQFSQKVVLHGNDRDFHNFKFHVFNN